MEITLTDLPALKQAYTQAVEAGNEQFEFNDATILTAYAKCLIEYMEAGR